MLSVRDWKGSKWGRGRRCSNGQYSIALPNFLCTLSTTTCLLSSLHFRTHILQKWAVRSIISATDSLPKPVVSNSRAPSSARSRPLSNTPRLFYGTIASASCSSGYIWLCSTTYIAKPPPRSFPPLQGSLSPIYRHGSRHGRAHSPRQGN